MRVVLRIVLIAAMLAKLAWGASDLPSVALPAVTLKDAKQPRAPAIPEKKLILPALPATVSGLSPQEPVETYSVIEVLKRIQRAAMEVRRVEVWSLDPSVAPSREIKKAHTQSIVFHDFHVLGREVLKDQEAGQKLLLSVALAISKGPDETYECFEPRHGLRIYNQKGFIDLALCFSCLNGVIYEGNEEHSFSTTADAEKDFDELFGLLGLKKAE